MARIDCRGHFNTVARTACILSLVTTLAAGAAERADASAKPPVNQAAKIAKAGAPIFTRDMSFGRAIEVLRQSTNQQLNIVVYWKEIADNASVFQDTPIGVDSVAGLTVGQHLEILLGSLSATSRTRLGYVVNRGVIVIATVDRLPQPRKVTRVYDVSDLVAAPSGAYGPAMWGGFGPGVGLVPGGTGQFGRYGVSGGQPETTRSSRRRTGRR